MTPISCDEAELLLSFLIDNEPFAEDKRQLLNEHLASCEKCRNELEQLQAVNSAIKHTLAIRRQQHLSTEELGAYIDQNIEFESEKLRIESHLDRCEGCQEAFHYLQLLNELRTTNQIKIPQIDSTGKTLPRQLKAFSKGLLSRIITQPGSWRNRLAYAIVGVGILVVLVLFIRRQLLFVDERKFPESQIVSEQPDSLELDQESRLADTPKSTPAKTPATVPEAVKFRGPEPSIDLSEAYAANFKPLPVFEAMLTYQARAFAVKVTSPPMNAEIKDEVFFEWEKVNVAPLQLKIFNNRGKEIFNLVPENNSYRFTEKLTAGLYYWKLESEEELLYLGKFKVTNK